MQWIKDETANRFQNCSEKGPRNKLVDYFLSIYPKFLKHSYVKREQEKAFTADRKRVNSDQHLSEAILQVDFAENFKCECQDEVQQAHYNQKQVWDWAIINFLFFYWALFYLSCLNQLIFLKTVQAKSYLIEEFGYFN